MPQDCFVGDGYNETVLSIGVIFHGWLWQNNLEFVHVGIFYVFGISYIRSTMLLCVLMALYVQATHISIFVPTTSNRLCRVLPNMIACSIRHQTVLPTRLVVGISDPVDPSQRCMDVIRSQSPCPVEFSIQRGPKTPGVSRNQALKRMLPNEAALVHDDDECAHPQAVAYARYLVGSQTADVHIFNYIHGYWNASLQSPFCPVNFSTVRRTTNVTRQPATSNLRVMLDGVMPVVHGCLLFATRPHSIYSTLTRGEDSQYLHIQLDANRTFMYSDFPLVTYNGPKVEALWSTKCASSVADLPRILWTVWFGQSIHGRRQHQLRRLDGIDIKHVHITADNLYRVNVSTDPIHPQITMPYLSGIHKGDYMRSYIMYHYGGAYTDIKDSAMLKWKPFFDDFKDANWVYGAREGGPGGVACRPDKLKRLYMLTTCKHVKSQWSHLLTNGAYIFRPYTLFAKDWLRENNKRLDELSDTLQKHPAPASRCCLGINPRGYPVIWAELHGDVFHPLSWKYRGRLQQSTIGFHF
jgi:hypothetical protein